MGIDMSRAFDTIKRKKILEVMELAGCNEDELRLIRTLLANSYLSVRVRTSRSAWYQTSIGSPQGDSLSPVLFTCYLAAALQAVRESTPWLNPPTSNLGMPHELEYADDVDFANEDVTKLNAILPAACNILKDWNLIINESKTEFSHIHLAVSNQTNDTQKGEHLRCTTSLDSKLDSTPDILHRCNLGNATFRSFWVMWMRQPLIPLQKRLQIYHAVVVSVMLYNCGSWAAPQSILSTLDKCHRRHLRSILRIHWPNTISNELLYSRCNTRPLSEMVRESRWRMLGHVLRMPPDTPAQQALQFAVVGAQQFKGRRGRHQTNLLETIRTDLRSVNRRLAIDSDIARLREEATDRAQWKDIPNIRHARNLNVEIVYINAYPTDTE